MAKTIVILDLAVPRASLYVKNTESYEI